MSLPNIDWNALWRENHARRFKSARDPGFWDERAPEFARHAQTGDYVSQFMAILKPQPAWRVLDIGSAAGTLAIPMAPWVKHVTAMDPSARMRELLQKRCEKEGIDNIQIVEGRWEDDWDALGIGVHDVAIASRSLIVDDLQSAMVKIQRHASHRVVLSAMVGDGPHDRRIFEAAGREFSTGADYIVLVNLLRQMGIFADLTFIRNSQQKSYRDVEDALNGMRWMLKGMTSDEEDRVRTYLTRTLVRGNGRWKLPYERVVRWAVIGWDMDNVDHPSWCQDHNSAMELPVTELS